VFDLIQDVIDVPLALTTVLQVRETSSLQRSFMFQNLTASVISVRIEYSADGGATWTLIDTAFDVGIEGGGTDVIVKNIIQNNILRVRASGGGDDRDMSIGLARAYLSTTDVWGLPYI